MKKLLKISALALTMAALLFSCANPSGESSSSSNSSSSSGKVDIPSVKEEAKVPTVTLEKQTFSSRKPGVTKDNIKDFDYNVVLKDLEETLRFVVGDLTQHNTAFNKEVLDPIMDKEGNPKNPIDLKLSDKNYTVEKAAEIVIKKGNVYIKQTVEGGNPDTNTPPTKDAIAALVDVDGSISIGGDAIKQLHNRDKDGKEDGTFRNNSIKAIKANVKANGGINLDFMKDMSDIEGAVTAAVSAKSAFETNKNAGYVTIAGNLTAKDIAAIYKAVAEAPENVSIIMGKLNEHDAWVSNHNTQGSQWYDKPEPAFPTDAELTVLYDWFDTLDVSVNVKVTFTDTADSNPYDYINITKLSDWIKLTISMTKNSSSNK